MAPPLQRSHSRQILEQLLDFPSEKENVPLGLFIRKYDILWTPTVVSLLNGVECRFRTNSVHYVTTDPLSLFSILKDILEYMGFAYNERYR